MESLDIDVVLEQNGGFEKFQKKIFFLLLSLVSAAGGLAIVVFVVKYVISYVVIITDL